MVRVLAAVLLVCALSACECCPETANGFSRGSCCCDNACSDVNTCAGLIY